MEYSLVASSVISLKETDMMRHNLCSIAASPTHGSWPGISKLFPEGPNSKYYRLVGHTVSDLTLQLCSYGKKAATEDT